MTDPTISRKEKNAPVQTTFERWIQASSNRYIDMIIPYDTEQDLEDMLKIIMPDVRFVGEEYKGKQFTGSDIEGNKIVYNKRQHSFSSSSLRKRVCEKKECMK
jgi:glycerol-3-phosphate cytidylyltransferase